MLNSLIKTRRERGALGMDNMGGHMDTLTWYASQVDSILELGTEQGNSTIAFLRGNPKRLWTVDINPRLMDQVEMVAYAKENGIDFQVIVADSANFVSPGADLLFVDSDHSYEHVMAELNQHAAVVNKFILFHDSHFCEGVRRAIDEFFLNHPEWVLHKDFAHCYGLTIYKRK